MNKLIQEYSSILDINVFFFHHFILLLNDFLNDFNFFNFQFEDEIVVILMVFRSNCIN